MSRIPDPDDSMHEVDPSVLEIWEDGNGCRHTLYSVGRRMYESVAVPPDSHKEMENGTYKLQNWRLKG